MSAREDDLPPVRDARPDVHLPGEPAADLFRPAVVAPLAPLVVLLHGGFWRAAYDRTHLRPMARALADLGLVVVTPEYRRIGSGGGWPATFDDVAESMRALPRLAAAAVGDELGPVVLVGHSAGGHLALWAAAAAPPSGLRAVVALAPVADLSAAFRDQVGGGAVSELMGGGPDDVPDRYRAGDPTLLRAPDVDVTIVHGSGDVVVPPASSVGYVQRHPQTRLVAADAGHFALIDPESPAWPLVVQAVNGAQ